MHELIIKLFCLIRNGLQTLISMPVGRKITILMFECIRLQLTKLIAMLTNWKIL